MKKISLNFFGEKAEITLPSDLKTLRRNICDQFLFSQADADELVISYLKGLTKVAIKTEADLQSIFQMKDVKELNLDVCESSKLYQEKKKSVEEELQILFAALEVAKKEENDLINQNSKLIAEGQNQQKSLKDQMRMLKDQLIKAHLDLKASTKENRIKIKNKRNTIRDLENQLNIPEEQKWNPIEEAKKMFTHEKRGCFGMKKERRERKSKGKMKENNEGSNRFKIQSLFKNHVEVFKNMLKEEKKEFGEKLVDVMKAEITNEKKENEEAKPIHTFVRCNGCGIKPIIGTRFKCAVCEDFDYCGNCESLNANIHQHPFICIRNPKLSPTAIKCCISDDMPHFSK